jgi:hypothetical protein
VFGIWRGYDPTTYAAATFLEMHQGAVRGLNTLLPGLALGSILLTFVLTWLARGKGAVFWLYLGALLLMVAGGVVTRFFNQPINAQVMTWTIDSLPADWADLRATWWKWHLIRTALSVGAPACFDLFESQNHAAILQRFERNTMRNVTPRYQQVAGRTPALHPAADVQAARHKVWNGSILPVLEPEACAHCRHSFLFSSGRFGKPLKGGSCQHEF